MAAQYGLGSATDYNLDASTNTQQNAQVTAQGDTYGSMNSVSAGSSVGTIYATDLGAIQAGQSIASQGLTAAAQSVKGAIDVSRLATEAAGDALKSKSESDVTKILKPVVIGAVLIVIALNFEKIKGAFK